MPKGLRGFQKGNTLGDINIGNKYGLGNKSNTGKKRSEEARRKQSIKLKGHIVSEETKRKIGLGNKGKQHWGEKNPSWKGGAWPYKKGLVKIRDNYTCQICGLRDPEIMEVDHIKQRSKFPELALELNNLVTLCPNCHRRKTNRELKGLS